MRFRGRADSSHQRSLASCAMIAAYRMPATAKLAASQAGVIRGWYVKSVHDLMADAPSNRFNHAAHHAPQRESKSVWGRLKHGAAQVLALTSSAFVMGGGGGGDGAAAGVAHSAPATQPMNPRRFACDLSCSAACGPAPASARQVRNFSVILFRCSSHNSLPPQSSPP